MARVRTLSRVGNLSPLSGRVVVGVPTVTAISPSEGVEAGGTEVVITGTQFYAGATVTVGGNACTSVVVVSDISIQCVTPAGTGVDDVVVTTSYGSGTLAGGFTYTATPSLITPERFSDWATQTPGATADIKGDLVLGTRKWNGSIGAGGRVIAATGLEFPAAMVNVFEALWAQPTPQLDLVRMEGLAAMIENDERYFRWYFRNTQPNGTSDTNTHPIEDGTAASSCNWSFDIYNNVGDDVYRVAIKSGNGTSSPYPNQVWLGPTIAKDETRRFEVMVRRTAAGYQLDLRVYNADDVTLDYDASDFLNPASVPLSTYMASNSFPVNNESMFEGFQGGCNDSETGVESTYGYEGGFAISLNQGWNGPYGNVTGEPT